MVRSTKLVEITVDCTIWCLVDAMLKVRWDGKKGGKGENVKLKLTMTTGRKGKGSKDPAVREAKLQQQAAALTSATNLTSTTTLTPATPSSSTASSSSSTPVNPTPPITGGPPRDGDPNHWSHDDKYDTDIFLESSYRKHLSRHANK